MRENDPKRRLLAEIEPKCEKLTQWAFTGCGAAGAPVLYASIQSLPYGAPIEQGHLEEVHISVRILIAACTEAMYFPETGTGPRMQEAITDDSDWLAAVRSCHQSLGRQQDHGCHVLLMAQLTSAEDDGLCCVAGQRCKLSLWLRFWSVHDLLCITEQNCTIFSITSGSSQTHV